MKTQNLTTQPPRLSWRHFWYYPLLMVAVYFGIKEGTHGLRYFAEYPENHGMTPWLLLPHIATGFVALTLGPFQFLKTFRQKSLATHRVIGRIYIIAVAISAFIGLYMAVVNEYLVFSTGITGLALAWIVTGFFAYATIRKGLVNEHREWMIRNYVVTFAFVSYRLGRYYLLSLGYEDTTIMAWMCWAPQLLICEYCIQLSHSKLFKKKYSDRRNNLSPPPLARAN